jgi:hypothetical protein
MNYQNISEIYAANDKIHEKLKETVSVLTDEQASFLPEEEDGGGKWTVANIVEHIAIVQEGMTQISAKLLTEAQKQGGTSDGAAKLSENFGQKVLEIADRKLEAPERVRPSGALSIAESLSKMDEARHKLEDLRPLFESVECSDFKFPHPFMGGLTAHEWLALIGGHKFRHVRQIQNILSRIK